MYGALTLPQELAELLGFTSNRRLASTVRFCTQLVLHQFLELCINRHTLHELL